MAFVSGMFPASKVGKGSFAGSTVAPRKVSKGTTTVMAVDSFQKQFQGFGKIAVDYKKGKRPFEFQRGTSGGSVTSLPFPDNQYFAGIYPISLCRRQTGVKRTLAKAEQMIAMDRFRQAKASATSSGIYNVRCTEGSVPQEAEFKRVFSRTNAFREAQKPINERIRKMYEDRKKMFMMADNSPSAEKKASTMPLVNKVSVASYNESRYNCSRYAIPQSVEENFIMYQYEREAKQRACPNGEYKVNCNDGVAKGMAEQLRVAVGSGRYRNQQKSMNENTQFLFNAPSDATMYTQPTQAQEEYFYKWPSTASAKIQD
mmetsp:Transcript_12185/g.37162  ORF Transcript_12185/g.37162 Transcript_12185/m.37162 type:complete len:315 (-) Transcript_12185:105-1049(-)|eukprot:CAMPEP_0198737692 /NCGR_PEP_ID=MMETSP1475-20131203/67977_1 /TAXON_ID= ORGANISM="Unidentified sp., Strain CCMP1999" /NCGR_SAMPLE_ID=MMETSP1475 /ASSEMBLY_ACC=CAM_ASM_001111 /LENGTH=314 /DNA_ID=CAMNT_0044501561 /DNA_START=52 /DNA_END=996 /DNA_ORIENTATION=+